MADSGQRGDRQGGVSTAAVFVTVAIVLVVFGLAVVAAGPGLSVGDSADDDEEAESVDIEETNSEAQSDEASEAGVNESEGGANESDDSGENASDDSGGDPNGTEEAELEDGADDGNETESEDEATEGNESNGGNESAERNDEVDGNESGEGDNDTPEDPGEENDSPGGGLLERITGFFDDVIPFGEDN